MRQRRQALCEARAVGDNRPRECRGRKVTPDRSDHLWRSLAADEPEHWAIEPKVDGVRGLVVFRPDGILETRNRHGTARDWRRGDGFEAGIRRLAHVLPLLRRATAFDGELHAVSVCPSSSAESSFARPTLILWPSASFSLAFESVRRVRTAACLVSSKRNGAAQSIQLGARLN